MPTDENVTPQRPGEVNLDIEVSGQEEFDNLWATRAIKMVHGEKAILYGHPRDVYSRAVIMWTAILGVPVTYTQFCYCMAALKMCRELNRPGMTEDNNVDIIGYIAVLNRIILKEAEDVPESITE